MACIVDKNSHVHYPTMQRVADETSHVGYPTIANHDQDGMNFGYQSDVQSTTQPVQFVQVLCPYMVVVPSDYAAHVNADHYGHGDGQAVTRASVGRPCDVTKTKATQEYGSKSSSGSTSGGASHESLSDVDSRSDVEEPQTPPMPNEKVGAQNGSGSSHAIDPPCKPPGLFFAPRNDSGSPYVFEPMPMGMDSESFWAMSMSNHGCRIVQEAIEDGSPVYRQKLVENLRGQVHRAYQSPHANFVLQKIIEIMPSDHYSFILEELEQQVHFVVRHRFGCRILQRILEHCTLEQIEPMMSKVVCDASALLRHQYGNFVLQHILQYGAPAHRHIVAEVVLADIISLAKHRLASHVVSCALVHCSSEDTQRLVHTLRDDPRQLAQLSRREFGSFVVREVNRAARIQGL